MTTLPRGRAFTSRDLGSMPDDGRRYELVDGALVVTPSPSRRHQRASLRLSVLLHEQRPEELEVLTAPFDVMLDDSTVLQPDLLVARRRDLTENDLPVAPLLTVEILSPSTRQIDLTLKRARYEAAGCPSYWVLDPDVPSITIWELAGDTYVERAHAAGKDTHTVARPFKVTITPDDLV